jgi:F-type H+-transporting ATPase subunit gamma
MKGLAAASIVQYERAVRSLANYYRAVQLGLTVCVRQTVPPESPMVPRKTDVAAPIAAIVFGSDQGLVGQFNDHLARFVAGELKERAEKLVYAAGERIGASLEDLGLPPNQLYSVPNSVTAITPLVSQILIDSERWHQHGEIYIFHNRPRSRASYEPVNQRLLPLDEKWQHNLKEITWPTKMLPQVMGSSELTIVAFIREYLFVSLFKACAESLASENGCRLVAMQRAEKNIGELLEALNSAFHQQRQNAIDEELFDVISGFEVLEYERKTGRSDDSALGPSSLGLKPGGDRR